MMYGIVASLLRLDIREQVAFMYEGAKAAYRVLVISQDGKVGANQRADHEQTQQTPNLKNILHFKRLMRLFVNFFSIEIFSYLYSLSKYLCIQNHQQSLRWLRYRDIADKSSCEGSVLVNMTKSWSLAMA